MFAVCLVLLFAVRCVVVAVRGSLFAGGAFCFRLCVVWAGVCVGCLVFVVLGVCSVLLVMCNVLFVD